MDEDTRDDLSALDPECLFRLAALILATASDESKDHHQILAKAATYYDFIDPFAMNDEGLFRIELKGIEP